MIFILYLLTKFARNWPWECVGCRALRVRKKTGGEKMPVQTIGDILAAELSHMQAYIRFCSCQLNGAALLQQKTDEDTEFKEFLKVTPFWDRGQATSFWAWRQRPLPVRGLGLGKGTPPNLPEETPIWQRMFWVLVHVELTFLATGTMLLPIY